MQVTFKRSEEWRQAQALSTGKSCQENAVADFTPEQVAALPADIKALLIARGSVTSAVQYVTLLDDNTIGLAHGYWSSGLCATLMHDGDAMSPDEFLAAIVRTKAHLLAEREQRKKDEVERDRVATVRRQEEWAEQAARDAREAEQKRLDGEADAKRRAELTAHVQRLGSDVLKRKWSAGLAGAKEVIDLVLADEQKVIPDGLTVHPHNTPLGEPKCDDDCGGYGPDVETSYEDVERKALTDDQFVNYERLVAALKPKNATVQPMMEIAECDGCKAKARTVFARCEWKVGNVEVAFDVEL